jgi:hypothetical protein
MKFILWFSWLTPYSLPGGYHHFEGSSTFILRVEVGRVGTMAGCRRRWVMIGLWNLEVANQSQCWSRGMGPLFAGGAVGCEMDSNSWTGRMPTKQQRILKSEFTEGPILWSHSQVGFCVHQDGSSQLLSSTGAQPVHCLGVSLQHCETSNLLNLLQSQSSSVGCKFCLLDICPQEKPPLVTLP